MHYSATPRQILDLGGTDVFDWTFATGVYYLPGHKYRVLALYIKGFNHMD